MKINSTAAKHIKKYCYIIGLLSFLIAFFACSQMLRYQEKEKKASGTYMAQSTIRRVKAKLDNYIMISDFLGNYIIDGPPSVYSPVSLARTASFFRSCSLRTSSPRASEFPCIG